MFMITSASLSMYWYPCKGNTTYSPRSLDPFHIVRYYIKWGKPSWTCKVITYIGEPADQTLPVEVAGPALTFLPFKTFSLKWIKSLVNWTPNVWKKNIKTKEYRPTARKRTFYAAWFWNKSLIVWQSYFFPSAFSHMCPISSCPILNSK